MRSRRSFLALAIAVVALVASAAAAAPAGGAPPGEGLVTSPFTFECEGIGTTTFTSVPGGPPGTGPAWATATGLLALVQEITITDAGAVVFEKTYGNKTGRGATFTCTATLPNGFFLEAELVAVT
jgi:hypothetical protein